MKLKNIINEILSSNILYHITTKENFPKILEKDALVGSYVSLTRDKNLRYISMTWVKRYARFYIDRDKLKSKYKLELYQDRRHNNRGQEAEERVRNGIANLGKYLIAIEFIHNETETESDIITTLLTYLKKYKYIRIINPPLDLKSHNENTNKNIEGIYQYKKGLISRFDGDWIETIENVLETNDDPTIKEIRDSKDEEWSDYGYILSSPVNNFSELGLDNFALVVYNPEKKSFAVIYSSSTMKSYMERILSDYNLEFRDTANWYRSYGEEDFEE